MKKYLLTVILFLSSVQIFSQGLQDTLIHGWDTDENRSKVIDVLEYDGTKSLSVNFVYPRRVKWQSDTDFDKGTFSTTERVGTEDSAYIQLMEKSDNDDDISYTTSSNYTLSDGTKIEVESGAARLVALSGNTHEWAFTSSSSYTYNASSITVFGGTSSLFATTTYASAYLQYHLNESSGTNAGDSSSYGRDGTLINMEDGDWGVAKLNNGLTFDGGNEYIDCGNVANFERTDAFSLEAWIKTAKTGEDILTRYSGKGFISYVASGGKIFFTLRNTATTNEASRYSNGAVTNDAWHHVVITYDGSSSNTGITIYIDGAEDTDTGSGINTLTGTIITGTNLNIGGRAGSANFLGSIDEAVVYDFELTSEQVTERYNSGIGIENLPISGYTYSTTNPTIETNYGFTFTSALNQFVETSTKSGNDEIKYHVSIDTGVTWQYWTGSSWTVTNDTYEQSNTEGDVQTNISTIASSGTFVFRALLHSDDGTTTPELDNILIAESATYSTDDNLYVDTKNASQIAPLDIIAWLTTTISNTKPANTDIRILLSTDGRVNWQKWFGSSWSVVSDSITRNNATSITNAETNFNILELDSGTIDVRLFLYTSDSSVRPVVSNINVTSDAGFFTTGTYTSNVYDFGYNSLDWGPVLWNITNSTITIKIRASNHSDVMGDYSSNLTNGQDSGVTGRYVQWISSFTGNGLISPYLHDLSIEFLYPAILEVTP